MEWYLKVVRDNYANFNGRARRKEYWMFLLINFIISILIGVVAGFLARTTNITYFAFLSTLYSLAVMIPSIAVAVRRVHDSGKSGWFVLVPFYNLYLMLIDSQPGENEYGPNPKGIGNTSSIDGIGRV